MGILRQSTTRNGLNDKQYEFQRDDEALKTENWSYCEGKSTQKKHMM